MLRRILAILTAVTVVLSAAFSAALWLLIAGFRSIAGFLGGSSEITPTLVLVCAAVIVPALMALAGILLRRHPAIRAVVVGIAFVLALLEAGFGVWTAADLYGGRPALEEAVPPSDG